MCVVSNQTLDPTSTLAAGEKRTTRSPNSENALFDNMSVVRFGTDVDNEGWIEWTELFARRSERRRGESGILPN